MLKKWDIMELNVNKSYVISIPDKSMYWDLIDDKIEIDDDRMKKRLILKPVETFYDALKWNLPSGALSNSNGAFNILKDTKK